MTFKLHYVDANGQKRHMLYDQHQSTLTDENGVSVLPTRSEENQEFYSRIPYVNYLHWKDAIAISPDSPGTKHSRPKRLKIQLGLQCNYTCSYCLQATQIGLAVKSSMADAQIFLKQLDKWLDPTDLEKIEFWGGEPLIYWPKIKLLATDLRERFPNVRFGIVTNGSLLTREIVDDLVKLGFTMSVSHDGPGQSIRGPDPFDEPGFMDTILYAMSKMNMTFLSVLSPISFDPSATKYWFFERMNREKLKLADEMEKKGRRGIMIDFVYPNVNFEGIVHDYNGDETSSLSEEKLRQLTDNVMHTLLTEGNQIYTFSRRLTEFIGSIVNRRPSRVLYQNCQMDRDDQMAVDLLGNIMTCQNVGAKGKHRIGNVMLLDKAKLDTSWHWSQRKECNSCPLLQLCKGACMYQEGNNFVSTCNSEFAYNMAFFLVAIKLLTGYEVYEVEGNMIRPQYT